MHRECDLSSAMCSELHKYNNCMLKCSTCFYVFYLHFFFVFIHFWSVGYMLVILGGGAHSFRSREANASYSTMMRLQKFVCAEA